MSSPSGLLGLERKFARGDLMKPKYSSDGLYIASWCVVRPSRLLSSACVVLMTCLVLHLCGRLRSSGAYVPCVTAQNYSFISSLPKLSDKREKKLQSPPKAQIIVEELSHLLLSSSATGLRAAASYSGSSRQNQTGQTGQIHTTMKRKKGKQFPRISGTGSSSVPRRP